MRGLTRVGLASHVVCSSLATSKMKVLEAGNLPIPCLGYNRDFGWESRYLNREPWAIQSLRLYMVFDI